MKKNVKVLLAGLALIYLMCMVVYGYMHDSSAKEERCRISIIVYGTNLDRWAFMREGISQGAKDFGAEVSVINMSSEADAKEQIDLLSREIENGAQGILMAAADSEAVNEAVTAAAAKVPVLMIETGIKDSDKTLGLLAADDYGMGKMLGEMVGSEHRKIALIYEYTERDSVKRRYQGFMDGVGEDADVLLWERGEGDFRLSLYIDKMYRMEGDGRALVALDDVALEQTLDAVTEIREKKHREESPEHMQQAPEVYGIGATDKIVYYLDKGSIGGLVFQNEFSIGYLGMEQMVNYLDNEASVRQMQEISIEYYKATRENMYDPELQRLLFPIVQ